MWEINRRNLMQALPLVLLVPHQARAAGCASDGTPEQFTPKAPRDEKPLQDELNKYQNCPYCGMSRREHHASRHLVHYGDDLVDATCSLHCAALSLALNVDRGPKAIYVADYGAKEEPRPLLEVDLVVYVLGSSLTTAMTTKGKPAFADRAAAEDAIWAHGGQVATFEEALEAAYGSMARDTLVIRQRRQERRQKQQAKGS